MKPVLLHYYITNRCNCRCDFCNIWNDQPKTDARADDVAENLRGARAAGCSFVDFTGGEPLLHPQCDVFLREAKRLGFFTSITTNCILFKKWAPKLSGLVDLLHFSLNADTPELHNALRGANCYDAVMESIPAAKESGLVPDILFTYDDRSINAFEGVYRLAREHRLMVILDPVFNTDGADTVSAETHRRASAYAKRRGVYLNTAHLALRKRGGNRVAAPLCRAVSSTVVLLPDNTLALPCFHHTHETVSVGASFAAALKSAARINALKEQGRYPFCESCHINCYFDPSYLFVPGILTARSLCAKAAYAFTKYVLYKRPIPRRRISTP